MPTSNPERATFRALSEATPHDWTVIDRAEREYRSNHGTGHGLLKVLASIADGDPMGVSVNLYTHSLQTATRVLEAGDNDHGLLAAQLLAPWISERRSWLLTHHVEFQNFHFANHPTRNRNERDRYIGHPYFAETAQFCELYDQNSFDPDYPTLPLAAFEPTVRRFFSGTPP
jgi:predicted HD phosphohydrolase